LFRHLDSSSKRIEKYARSHVGGFFAWKGNRMTVMRIVWKQLHQKLGWRALPFLVGTFAGLGSYRREILSPTDDEGLAAAKKRLALLGLIYRRLIPRLGESTARDTVCELAAELAASVQRAMYMPGGRQTTWERFHEKHEREMSAGLYRFNRYTPAKQDERTYRFEIERCVFLDAFRAMGIEEATEGFCRSDEVVYNQCVEDMSFHRGTLQPNTLARGANRCAFLFERKE
jgi:hypothetical protein